MYTFFLVMYLLVAISLVLLIMVQQGRGIDVGGDSCRIPNLLGGWGANCASHFMTRLITVLGVIFFVLSLLLGNISSKYHSKDKDSEESSLIRNNGSLLHHNKDHGDDNVGSIFK